MVKFVTAKEAAACIPDQATMLIEGFIGSGVADEVHEAIGERFEQEGHPKQVTLIHAAGIGDANHKGMNYYAHEGMVKRIIGGHWAMAPQLHALVEDNKIEAYNFPQGVISQMTRDASAHRPYFITNVGVDTFVDPIHNGGKLNEKATEDLVKRIEIEGEPYLAYKTFKPNVAILRGSYADERGNISFEDEPLTLEATSEAMAAKNNGGIVIVQVKEKVKDGTLNPKMVKIPSVLVDYVVVVQNHDHHKQTYNTQYNEALLSSDLKYIHEENEAIPLTIRKIIGRRASLFLPDDAKVVNYGIGMPEMVAKVFKEEGLHHRFMNTVEPGTFGGAALSGMDFGTALAPEAVIDQPYMFDFYDGGGIDITFLGMAECDENGNINVSKFSHRIAGAGGFINISQNTPIVVFCGTFMAGGLKMAIADNELVIEQEGKNEKFVPEVSHVTFSGTVARRKGQQVYYVTERAVFKLVDEGIELIEVAPGIDIQRDVLDHMGFTPKISDHVTTMDERIFKEALMHLA